MWRKAMKKNKADLELAQKRAYRREITARQRAGYKVTLKKLGLKSAEKLLGALGKMSDDDLAVIRTMLEKASTKKG
jgi:hypothetical protein